MAAITTALIAGAAVVGAGTAAYGAYEASQGRDKAAAAAQAQSQAASVQNAVSIQQQQLQAQYAISQSDLQAQYAIGQSQSSAQFAGQETALNIEGAQASLLASEQSFGINQGIIRAQQNIGAQRMQAMEIDARRKQMDNLRQAQRARALGTIAASAQGALFSTGLQGGRGQISGQANVNQLGITQNLEIGRNIFTQNAAISRGRLAQGELDLSLARQRASLQTRDTQLKSLYAQTQADVTSQYYATAAAQQSAFMQQNATLSTMFTKAGGQINTQQGQVAAGQGQASFGQSLIGAGAGIFQAGVTGANVFPNLFGGTTPTVQSTGVNTYP